MARLEYTKSIQEHRDAENTRTQKLTVFITKWQNCLSGKFFLGVANPLAIHFQSQILLFFASPKRDNDQHFQI